MCSLTRIDRGVARGLLDKMRSLVIEVLMRKDHVTTALRAPCSIECISYNRRCSLAIERILLRQKRVLFRQNAFSYDRNVSSYDRMCSLTTECVLLRQKAFFYDRMRSLTTECVLLQTTAWRAACLKWRQQTGPLSCSTCASHPSACTPTSCARSRHSLSKVLPRVTL